MTDNSIFENKTASYYTLGCKLNFAETSSIGRSLLDQGVRTARTGERADICVINTCSVTELADKKCRNMIRKAHREHPGAFVVVTGCYAQLSPEEVASIEGVNLVLGSEQKLDVVHYLSSMEQLDANTNGIVASKTKDIHTFQISSSSDQRTRHFLKVQDGCDYHCSYCTIPKARGRSRNGSIEQILSEVDRIVAEGGKEIVLTGVNIGDFGRTTGESFYDLVRALDRVEAIERFRISSIEPNLLTDEIIDYCASSARIAPHFHIPLQSGSDEVLKLMRRRYDSQLFRRRVEHIKSVLPHAFIGIDVIVGTRGELPEYFEDCYRFLEEIPFSQLHVFSYSERAGTMALQIPHQVDLRDKHKRSQRLMRLSEQRLREFYQGQIGRTMKVIWEHGADENGMSTGFTENYTRVARPFDSNLHGQVETICPTALHESGNYLIL